MELNTINNTGSWGDAAARLNENFSKVNAEVEKARLASSKNKGLFGSLESLRSAYPTPQVGDWAVVGDSIPGPVYRCTHSRHLDQYRADGWRWRRQPRRLSDRDRDNGCVNHIIKQ